MLDRLSSFLASVLPSSDKSRQNLQYRTEKCLNCEHPLDKSDVFCPHCSQLNSNKKLHFSDLFNEFFASIFAYDSRLVKTLKIIMFRPGIITKQYVAGKRMTYANPFRFYLSVSIIFFLLLGLISKIEEYSYQRVSSKSTTTKPVKTSVKSSEEAIILADSISKAADRTKQLPDAVKKNLSAIAAQDTLFIKETQIKETSKKSEQTTPEYISETTLDTLPKVQKFWKRVGAYQKYHKEYPQHTPRTALENIGHHSTTTNLWLYKKVADIDFFRKNPSFATDYFLSKLPFVIFFFIPVFAFCIKLVYIRRDFTYMEHLLFAFHVQSFFFVLMILASFFDFIFITDVFISIFLFAFCLYLYKAMRNFYEQGRFKTIVKFMILNTLFSILATFTAVVYALLSFSLY
ncbi:MAG TPA: DUF3667 domain-containing protein [Flavobacteriaceae bacterium]|nr:DUF3667 domain-containing protein [Flavobacteriaceae bacterium]